MNKADSLKYKPVAVYPIRTKPFPEPLIMFHRLPDRRLFASAALSLSLAAIGVALPAAAAQAAPPAQEKPQLAGGWHAVAKNDPNVQAMARFAVAKHAESSRHDLKLVSVIQANQQVVAGTNYQLTMIVTSRGKKQKIAAKVWSKLDGTQELSSWLIKR